MSFSLFIFVALKIGSNLKKTESSPKIPPGPWKIPIIGNIDHFVTSTPHRKLRDLAKIYGPLMHLQLGEIFTIIVLSPEYAKEIMKIHDVIFASRTKILLADIICYESTSIIFAPYENYWRQLRKICTVELLAKRRVNSFKQIREEELINLVKRIDSHKGSPMNLTEAVFLLIYNIISRAAFGMKCKDQEEFISVVKEAVTIVSGFNIGDLFPSAKWLQLVTGLRPKLERLHRILEDIINDRNQDISLTINNIEAMILDVVGAGGETSATTINWAMAEVIRDPRVMNKAQVEVREAFNMKGRVDKICINNELKYLKSVVKETLRLHPPAPILLPRECGQTCDINGYHIPFKSKVIVNAWAIERDPKYWSEAERFYPERFFDSSIDYKGNSFEFIHLVLEEEYPKSSLSIPFGSFFGDLLAMGSNPKTASLHMQG